MSRCETRAIRRHHFLMATSERKRRANRNNAKKSTGPKTAAGKARSKMNALKHGMLSSEALIADGETKEDASTHAALRDQLQADLAPVGFFEELLVDRLVTDIWRLRRVLRYETGATRESADEVVADWSAQQAEAQRRRARLDDLFPDRPPSPPQW